MTKQGLDTDLMMMRIEDIIIKTIISIEPKMYKTWEKSVPFRTNCFQFLGFDILIDSNLKPWLLEVNMSSSLATETNMDFKIKSAMMANILSLVGVEPLSTKYNVSERINPKFAKFQDFRGGMNKKTNKGKKIRKKELIVIQETREEILRSKQWKLIYPSYNVSLYKNYFEEDRPFNMYLRNE